MPKKSATEYIEHLHQSGKLEDAIEAAARSKDFFSTAAEAGYEFDAQEWAAALEEHASGGLSIEELDAVTGGAATVDAQGPTLYKGMRNY